MKYLVAGIVLLGVLSVFLSQTSIEANTEVLQQSENRSVYELFEFWKAYHNKRYANEVIENYRFKVFAYNWYMIQESNAAGKSYKLEINQFSDMTDDEWMKMYLTESDHQDGKVEDDFIPSNDIPFNWVDKGAVGPVKNQGKCGSCWSFATTGVVEGYWFINHGSLPSLSEQQLVDCSTQNSGCNGGLAWIALTYVQNNGLVTELEYPYVSGTTSTEGTCVINQGPYKVGKVIQGNGCQQLKSKVITQPTGVSVDASNWKSYKSGVFSNCGTSTNHAVLVVGWDDEGNWLIKNSWGTGWGEQGYIKLAPGNTCAVCYRLANAAV